MIRYIFDYPIKLLNEFSKILPSLGYLVEFFDIEGPLDIAWPPFHE